jgi:hypothetical protein
MGDLIHILPAIDVDYLAGNETCKLAREIDACGGDLVYMAERRFPPPWSVGLTSATTASLWDRGRSRMGRDR